MFVRINKGEDHTSIIEGSRVSFNQSLEVEDKLVMTIERSLDNGSVTFELQKGEDEVYLMNENGRTIDTYRWAAK